MFGYHRPPPPPWAPSQTPPPPPPPPGIIGRQTREPIEGGFGKWAPKGPPPLNPVFSPPPLHDLLTEHQIPQSS